eukprot:2543733-Ditylum_brightwellii.AAC.1
MSLSLSQRLHPSNSALITHLDHKNRTILKSAAIKNDPSFDLSYLEDNVKKEKCSSLPNCFESNDLVGNKYTKRKPPVKKHKTDAEEITIKKPRSPYSLFFQVERELIMSDLSCPPETQFLIVYPTSPYAFKK